MAILRLLGTDSEVIASYRKKVVDASANLMGVGQAVVPVDGITKEFVFASNLEQERAEAIKDRITELGEDGWFELGRCAESASTIVYVLSPGQNSLLLRSCR